MLYYLLLIYSTIVLSAEMITPLFSSYVEFLGGNLQDSGILFSVLLIVNGILVLIFGKLEDVFKNLELWLSFSLFLKFIAYLSLLFISNVFQFVFIQILLGISEAILVPSLWSLYTKLVKEHHAEKWGIAESTYCFSAAFGGILGGFIAQNFGFKILIVVITTFSFLSFLLSLFLLKKEIIQFFQ